MPPVLFATSSAESRSLPLSAQQLVNLFTEKQDQGAKSQTPLFGVPGLTAFAQTAQGPVRGFWVMGDILYAVSANSLYRVDSSGNSTALGSGIGGNAVVSMADNGMQLCIVNGVSGWIYSVTSGFQQITDAAFAPARTVEFFDGYFVFDHRGTNQFFLSALYDGLTYNALDFASAESSPDFVVGTVQNLQLLFIFCEQHIEMWYDAGSADFPFQRYAGGVIPYGCTAPYSIIKQDQAIFFLGNDKIFYRLQGSTPIRVSTHEMETIIAKDSNITVAFCTTYTLEGHKFINLTLPNINKTLVFDTTTQRWHERESWDSKNASLGRWRGNAVVSAYGNNYVGDAFNGSINKIDWSVYTEVGNTIRGLAHSIPYHSDRKRLFISRFELDIQAGVGLTTGQGSDPQIMLSWSKDGGHTWLTLQPWRSMGKIGEYLRRLRWLRLGQARQWVFRISITDPVQRVVIAAHADMEAGM